MTDIEGLIERLTVEARDFVAPHIRQSLMQEAADALAAQQRALALYAAEVEALKMALEWRPATNNNVTRFEVIDQTGRAYTKYDVAIELSYQDDGRTLKVFVRSRG